MEGGAMGLAPYTEADLRGAPNDARKLRKAGAKLVQDVKGSSPDQRLHRRREEEPEPDAGPNTPRWSSPLPWKATDVVAADR